MKPLFVPLKTEYFRAFESGVKKTEYRLYGPRWNENTVIKGRPVTLSHGYSGARISAIVKDLRIVKMDTDTYGKNQLIACIDITFKKSA